MSGESTHTLRKIAAAISKHFKVTVEFAEEGVAHSNPRKRKITLPLKTVYEEGEDYVVGLLLHEVAHIRFSPPTQPKIKGEVAKKYPAIASGVFNWLEDRRIDGLMRQEYAGAAVFQDALYTPTFERIQGALEKTPRDTGDTPVVRGIWWINALGLATLEAHGAPTAFCEVGQTELRKLALAVLAPLYRGIHKDSTGEEVLEAAEKVLKVLEPYLPPPQEKGEREAEQEVHILGGIKPVPKELAEYHDIKRERIWLDADKRAQEKVPLLKKKLIAKLRDTEHEKWVGEQRRGRLDKKRLVRVAYQENPKLYRKRLEKKGKRYSFGVVLDTSGSMFQKSYGGASNIASGAEAASLITRTVRGLGFKSFITIYGYEPRTVLYPSERYVADEVHSRLMNTSNMMYQSGGNDTYKAITEAVGILKKQPHEKVLVVITDGSLEGGDVAESKRQIEEAKRKGIHTILFYLLDRSARILGDSKREKYIGELSELVPAITSLLKGMQV